MRLTFLLSSLVAATSSLKSAEAVCADSTPIEKYETDGTYIGMFTLRGTEVNDWMEDSQGYSVCDTQDNRRRRALERHLQRHKHIHKGMRGAHQEVATARTVVYRYYYCVLDDEGDMMPNLDWPVIGTDPDHIGELQPNLHISREKAQELHSNRRLHLEDDPSQARRLSQLTAGTIRNLVVLFRFSDHASKTLPTKEVYETVMNSMSPVANIAPNGGVKKMYHEFSGGKLNLESTVADWVTLDAKYTEQYCSGGDRGMTLAFSECLENALSKVDQTIDFSQFDSNGDNLIDGIAFLHSGQGAESTGNTNSNIWSHKWCLGAATGYCRTWTSAEGVGVSTYHVSSSIWAHDPSLPVRVGLVAHETAHFFGLPDLYDYDGGGSGVGTWSLMGNSWGWDNSGNFPPRQDPWADLELGWGTATTITSSVNGLILKPSYTDHEYYKIEHGFPAGEYLLIENRQKIGFDAQIPQAGILIWHIDTTKNGQTEEGYPGQSGWPENGRHYKVAVVQADGKYDIEKTASQGDHGDVYREGGVTQIGPGTQYPNTNSYQNGNIVQTGVTIKNIRSAGGNNMQFDVCLGTCAGSGPSGPDTTPSPTPQPTPQPTAASGGGCVDMSGWVDYDGVNCLAWAAGGWCNDGDTDPEEWWDPSSGYTAKQACCACGGGSTNPPVDWTNSNGCQNVAGWMDQGETPCLVWEKNKDWCAYGGDYYNIVSNVTATQACCVCGGGT